MFFKEPCLFDCYEETRAVADEMGIPIAGGEEESSVRQVMWLMDKGVVSIVQPDILFFGGLIRSIRTARMAEAIGIDRTPHISGRALGFRYILRLALPTSGHTRSAGKTRKMFLSHRTARVCNLKTV